MTLVELVKKLEKRLKETSSLFTSYTKEQMDPVKLKSLKILELRDYTEGKKRVVRLILDATFLGKEGPHKCTLSTAYLNALGIDSVSIGMGAFTYDTGIVTKGMTVVLNKAIVEGVLKKELASYRDEALEQSVTAALQKMKASKAYKKTGAELAEAIKKAAKAQEKVATLQNRIGKLHTKAVEQARLIKPAKAAPFEICIA